MSTLLVRDADIAAANQIGADLLLIRKELLMFPRGENPQSNPAIARLLGKQRALLVAYRALSSKRPRFIRGGLVSPK